MPVNNQQYPAEIGVFYNKLCVTVCYFSLLDFNKLLCYDFWLWRPTYGFSFISFILFWISGLLCNYYSAVHRKVLYSYWFIYLSSFSITYLFWTAAGPMNSGLSLHLSVWLRPFFSQITALRIVLVLYMVMGLYE